MEFEGKKGLSGVVSVVILIALTVALVAIVWSVVNNLVNENIEATSCLDVLNEIEINRLYTCYNSSGSGELQFSISMGEAEIESLLVSIASQGSSNTFRISPAGTDDENLEPFSEGGPVRLPGKNSGLTYRYPVSSEPDLLEISPKVGDTQCETMDKVLDFPNCASLV